MLSLALTLAPQMSTVLIKISAGGPGRPGSTFSSTALCGGHSRGPRGPETGRGRSIARLFADERCSEAILEFVRTTWGRRSRMRQRSRGARYRRSPAQQVSVCGGCADRLDDGFPFVLSILRLHSLVSGAASD